MFASEEHYHISILMGGFPIIAPGAISHAHCSNPEVRIRKKMQPKFEAAVRTLMKKSFETSPHMTWLALRHQILMVL